MSFGDRAVWVFAIAVFGLLWVVFGGGWLAAKFSGESLGVSGTEALEVLPNVPSHLSDPAAAWPRPASRRLPGPVAYWASTGVAALPLVVIGWLWSRRRPRKVGLDQRVRLGVNAEARMATVDDLSPMLIDKPTTGRFTLGTVHDRIVATELPVKRPTKVTRPKTPAYRPARGSVFIVGPTQCGKSTAAICGVLEWDGPALISSVKTDLLRETFGWRSTQGECRVFDPVQVTGFPAASWSPLRGARSVEGAQSAARSLVDCAPRDGMSDGSFWFQEAEMVLAGYMWVAANHGLGMRDVVRWVLTQDFPKAEDDPGEVSPLLMASLTGPDPSVAEQAATVSEFLEGVWGLHDEMRSSVFGTAAAAVWPWTNPKVVGSSTECDITLDWLLSGNNTVYLSAPLRAAKRLAPALGGAIGDLLEQVSERVARTGEPLDPCLLVVLDEVGNTPLRDLPELAATLAGLGVILVTIWQNVAQVKAAYREHAGTILANHRTKLFFSGISDPDTFELAVRLVGDEQVVSRQLSSDLAMWDSGRKSLQESTITTSVVPGHVLRQQPSGTALMIHGTIAPAHLRVRSHLEEPDLLDRANHPLPPTDTADSAHGEVIDVDDTPADSSRSLVAITNRTAPSPPDPERESR